METDLTPDESTVDTAAAEAAETAEFESGFNGGESATPAPAPAPAPAPTPAPAPAAETPAPAPAADPYADLPQNVREQLARIPELEHAVASNNGRVSALSRQLDEARRKATPAPEPAPAETPASIASVETVRAQLPEVAAAIEDAVKAAMGKTPAAAAPAPTPAAAATSVEEGESDEAKLLARVHGDWAPTMNGTDFKLWVGTLPAERRDEILSTTKAIVIAAALSEFKEHRSAVGKVPEPASVPGEQRRSRLAAAVQPQGSGRRAASSTTPTEEEEFAAGFNGE